MGSEKFDRVMREGRVLNSLQGGDGIPTILVLFLAYIK